MHTNSAPKTHSEQHSNEKLVVALSLGSSRAKIGIAGFNPDDPDHRLTVYDMVQMPTVDSVRYGRINNIREASATVGDLLRKIDKKPFLEGRSILSTYISIGGRSLKATKISGRIELPTRTEITEELIDRLREDAVRNLKTTDELICIEPIRFTVDNMPTPRPVGSLGSRIAGEFTAVVCNQSNKNDIIDLVTDRVGLGISGISVSPLALAHLVLSPQETNAGCMLVDIGAETITVAIYKKYALQYLATIPIGSRLITRDMASVLALTEEEAETLKIRMADAMPDPAAPKGEDSRLQETVNAVVAARLADIIANIGAQPGFAGMSNDVLPAGIILAGGGARMPNIAPLLQSQTGMKVRIATVPPDIYITDDALSNIDNLDIIALLNESAESARLGSDPECMSAPMPKPKAKAPVPEKKASHVVVDLTPSEKPAESHSGVRTTDDYYESHFGDYAGDSPFSDDYYIESNKSTNRPDDNTTDEAREKERIRRQNKQKQLELEEQKALEAQLAEERRQQKLKEERDQRRKEQKEKIDRIINRFTGFLNGSGEDKSAEMD